MPILYDDASTQYDSSSTSYDGEVGSGCTYNEPAARYNEPTSTYNNFCLPVIPPPFVPPAETFSPNCTSTNAGIGWAFYLLQPGLAPLEMFPQTGISLDMDTSRDVSRSISGMQLPPEEAAKCDFSRDSVAVYLQIDGVIKPMSQFRFTEVSIQKDVLKTSATDDPQDWFHLSLNDRAIELMRNTGEAQTVVRGTDPTQVMRTLTTNAGVPAAIGASVAPVADSVTWDGSVTDLTKFRQMAEFAGHRPPWTDNNGVVRSVSASLPVVSTIDLMSLSPQAGSIVVTPTFLGAPNRVIVTDNTFSNGAIRGQWDAPGSSPNSAGQRGYVQTEMVDQSGLLSAAAASAIARQIGERLTARRLDATIKPTWLLDGPVVLEYDGARWRVESWSVSTEAGALMQVSATEVLGES